MAVLKFDVDRWLDYERARKLRKINALGDALRLVQKDRELHPDRSFSPSAVVSAAALFHRLNGVNAASNMLYIHDFLVDAFRAAAVRIEEITGSLENDYQPDHTQRYLSAAVEAGQLLTRNDLYFPIRAVEEQSPQSPTVDGVSNGLYGDDGWPRIPTEAMPTAIWPAHRAG